MSKLFLFFNTLILLYTSFLLINNISCGFDITDESYYILTARYPNEIFSTVTHDGYYTGLLYYLTGYNLAYFRLLGIVILVGISCWFAVEFYRYIINKFNFSYNILDKYFFLIPIVTGSLAYYESWILTPSYNWLSIISVLLVFSSLFRVINNKELNYNRYITFNYVILSFSFNLSFMAKPTTALGIIIISLLFIIYEFKNINFKKALPSVIILTLIITTSHILLLDGSFTSYYNRLIETMIRLELLGGGHTLDNRYIEMVELIKQFFFKKFYFHQIPDSYIYAIGSVIVILFIIQNKVNALKIYAAIMWAVLIAYSFFMFEDGIGNGFLWIRSVELLFLNIIFFISIIFFIDKKKEYFKNIFRIITLILITVMGGFVYKFGSNNHIIYAMSDSMIFVVSSTLVLNYLLDKRLNTRILTTSSGLILSIFIYFIIDNGYKNPYRLITDIKGQDQYVDFLGGLSVDKQQKKYIEDLQKIANQNKSKNSKISLIDMTGGSPGANVILDAEFFGQQWLIGSYRGSNEYATRILYTYKNTNKLREAWILIAPDGARKLDLKILNNVGLNFPSGYKKIGVVTSAHRNESQELWKPKI